MNYSHEMDSDQVRNTFGTAHRSADPESLIYVLVIRERRKKGAWPSQDKAAAS